MADFEIACELLLKNEGGYSNHKDDSGGATNYGISAALLNSDINLDFLRNDIDLNRDGFIDSDEIKYLDIENAKEIYKNFFWNQNNYGDIKSQSLANQLLDFSAHSGSYRANKVLQSSINEILDKINAKLIEEDGICGSITIYEANFFNDCLVDIYKEKRVDFYTGLCQRRPKNNVFLKGWLRRIEHD